MPPHLAEPPEDRRPPSPVAAAPAALADVEVTSPLGLAPDDAVVAVEDGDGSVGRRAARGANWTVSARLVVQVVQFATGIVLARLLTPADFGLLATVYVIYGFSVLLFELGLGSALIQRKEPTEQDRATVFWVNVLGGVVLAALLYAAGPLVAAFYGQPVLRWLTPVLGLSFTLSFGVVHSTMLERALRFKAIAVIETSAAVIGFAVTALLALWGWGPYSLVTGPVVSSLLSSVFAVALVRWRPRHFVSAASLRDLWRFSGGLLGFRTVNYWARNVDSLLIGRFVGVDQLGTYNRAYNLMLLPVYQITGALGRVMFPVLSGMQDDLPRSRAAYLRSTRVVNALAVPCLLGLAAVADGLVPLLWGSRWLATIPLLQILCVAGLPQCLLTSMGWIYQAQGATGAQFRRGLVVTGLGVAAMVVGVRWGATGVAVAVLARYWLELPWQLHVGGALIGLRARTVLKGAVPTAIASCAMASLVYVLPPLLGADRAQVWVVAVQVAAGAAAYGGVLLLIDRRLVLDVGSVLRRR